MTMNNSIKIVAVVVTFNRLDKLKTTLSHYDQQASEVNHLIVVDNCSTDGTRDFLHVWEKEKANREVIYMEENLGGSGGFHDGCKRALELNPDWVFVADDDAYLDASAMLLFRQYVESNDVSNVSAICGSVFQTDGSYALKHRRMELVKYGFKPVSIPSTEDDYKKTFFEINTFSYVGTFMKCSSLKKVGLCNRNFFIYYDDSEHAMRLCKDGKIYCVPEIKIIHDDGFNKNQAPIPTLSWRDYYSFRNKLYTLLHHQFLAGLYIIATYIYDSYLCGKIKKAGRKIFNTAISDALSGRLGKHIVYKPGFVLKDC